MYSSGKRSGSLYLQSAESRCANASGTVTYVRISLGGFSKSQQAQGSDTGVEPYRDDGVLHFCHTSMLNSCLLKQFGGC